MPKTPRQQKINASGWRAVVKSARRSARRRLNSVLARWFGTARPRCAALAPDTRRVLVVRLNKRLGNILFLTPMLRNLATRLPGARIDVLIQDSAQRPLLESLPGVDRVWVQPKNVFALWRMAARMRDRHYDLAIDPCVDSTSNRLAVALSDARQRMGFASPGQWLSLTHAAARPASRHQAKQAVQLVHDAVDASRAPVIDSLWLCPDGRARAAAQRCWQRLFGAGSSQRPVIGFFIGATGDKRFEPAWWRQWHAALRARAPGVCAVEIRAPGHTRPLIAGLPSVGIAELDVLAAFIARLDGFIAADSGPMHLAAAAGTPVVGLFRATDPEAYAPLGRRCTTLVGACLRPAEAVASIVAVVRAPA